MHKIRASGSYIAGTNGHSNGLVPMLRVYNDTARFVSQGGGKRNGTCASADAALSPRRGLTKLAFLGVC